MTTKITAIGDVGFRFGSGRRMATPSGKRLSMGVSCLQPLPCVVVIVCCAVLASSPHAQAADKQQKLEKLLKRHPDADANKDGKLTIEEAKAYAKPAAEKDGVTAVAKPDVTTNYGPVADRQKVNLYLAPASRPCPVFLLAHSNGETFNDVPQVLVDICKSRGISVVSWESVENLSAGKIDTLWADSKVILQWIKNPEIARQYRFDPTQIILYGGSRGSWASWQIGHSGDPAIKGLFLYRALPSASSTMPEVYEMITKKSPPAIFMYHATDNKGATHDMKNGQLAVKKYESLGLTDRVLIDTNIKSKADGFVKHLPDFIKRVLPKEFHGL